VSALFSAESRAFAAFSVSVSIWVLLAFFEMHAGYGGDRTHL
jgi:hypothetical protein